MLVFPDKLAIPTRAAAMAALLTARNSVQSMVDFLLANPPPALIYPTQFTQEILPKVCPSALYLRAVPLLTGLAVGVTSTEADLWLIDGELFVGHTRDSLTPNRTLASMYLDPIMEILAMQNPSSPYVDANTTTVNGIYDSDPSISLQLILDYKSNGTLLHPYVLSALEPLRSKNYLTTYSTLTNTTTWGPITIVASGNSPDALDQIIAQEPRDVFFDAPLGKLRGVEYGKEVAPLASGSFKKLVGWSGAYRVLNGTRAVIASQLAEARELGIKVRYWDTPGIATGLHQGWADTAALNFLRASSSFTPPLSTPASRPRLAKRVRIGWDGTGGIEGLRAGVEGRWRGVEQRRGIAGMARRVEETQGTEEVVDGIASGDVSSSSFPTAFADICAHARASSSTDPPPLPPPPIILEPTIYPPTNNFLTALLLNALLLAASAAELLTRGKKGLPGRENRDELEEQRARAEQLELNLLMSAFAPALKARDVADSPLERVNALRGVHDLLVRFEGGTVKADRTTILALLTFLSRPMPRTKEEVTAGITPKGKAPAEIISTWNQARPILTMWAWNQFLQLDDPKPLVDEPTRVQDGAIVSTVITLVNGFPFSRDFSTSGSMAKLTNELLDSLVEFHLSRPPPPLTSNPPSPFSADLTTSPIEALKRLLTPILKLDRFDLVHSILASTSSIPPHHRVNLCVESLEVIAHQFGEDGGKNSEEVKDDVSFVVEALADALREATGRRKKDWSLMVEQGEDADAGLAKALVAVGRGGWKMVDRERGRVRRWVENEDGGWRMISQKLYKRGLEEEVTSAPGAGAVKATLADDATQEIDFEAVERALVLLASGFKYNHLEYHSMDIAYSVLRHDPTLLDTATITTLLTRLVDARKPTLALRLLSTIPPHLNHPDFYVALLPTHDAKISSAVWRQLRRDHPEWLTFEAFIARARSHQKTRDRTALAGDLRILQQLDWGVPPRKLWNIYLSIVARMEKRRTLNKILRRMKKQMNPDGVTWTTQMMLNHVTKRRSSGEPIGQIARMRALYPKLVLNSTRTVVDLAKEHEGEDWVAFPNDVSRNVLLRSKLHDKGTGPAEVKGYAEQELGLKFGEDGALLEAPDASPEEFARVRRPMYRMLGRVLRNCGETELRHQLEKAEHWEKLVHKRRRLSRMTEARRRGREEEEIW
ncbi:hypothetical protein MNV49_001058 [Pseudohyphozyma bogoriensis]|nr:hypothetical protein MNV49_001058 [Pseudohyphozyma bogoriensis]